MLRKLSTAVACIAVAVSALTPGIANARPHGEYYQQVDRDGGNYGRGYGGRGYDDRRYYEGRRRHGPCRDNGTAGTIIGAIAGGLLGNDIGNGRYNNRDGTGGTIVGAGLGALAGRAIDRDC